LIFLRNSPVRFFSTSSANGTSIAEDTIGKVWNPAMPFLSASLCLGRYEKRRRANAQAQDFDR
jgi:hypothetical protein